MLLAYTPSFQSSLLHNVSVYVRTEALKQLHYDVCSVRFVGGHKQAVNECYSAHVLLIDSMETELIYPSIRTRYRVRILNFQGCLIVLNKFSDGIVDVEWVLGAALRERMAEVKR